MSDQSEQRSPFSFGADCSVTFIESFDNAKAYADFFEIEAQRMVFDFQMMKMRHRKEQDPWVFGSFKRNGILAWSFRGDSRVQNGFSGNIYTMEYRTRTYALYVNHQGVLKHVVPFVDLLLGKEQALHPVRERSIIEEIDRKRVQWEAEGRFARHNPPKKVARKVQKVVQPTQQPTCTKRPRSVPIQKQVAPETPQLPDTGGRSEWDFFVNVLSRMGVRSSE